MAASLVWLRAVEGVRPDRWDLIGGDGLHRRGEASSSRAPLTPTRRQPVAGADRRRCAEGNPNGRTNRTANAEGQTSRERPLAPPTTAAATICCHLVEESRSSV